MLDTDTRCGQPFRTVIDPSEVQVQVAKIRAEVSRRGAFTVDRQWLRQIVPDELTQNQRFAHIAAMAQREGWRFQILLDGSVHLASRTKPATDADVPDGIGR